MIVSWWCASKGPKAIGMPELHKLTPPLGRAAKNVAIKFALVTDGRMSGASGKVPAAIHVTPEAVDGGLIAKVHDGDLITLNALTGEVTLRVDEQELAQREFAACDLTASHQGMGRGVILPPCALSSAAAMSVVTLHPSELKQIGGGKIKPNAPKSNFRGREPALVLVT